MQVASLLSPRTASVPVNGSETPAKAASAGFHAVLFRAGVNTEKEERESDARAPEKSKAGDQPFVSPIDLTYIPPQTVLPPFRFGMPVVLPEAKLSPKQTDEPVVPKEPAQPESEKSVTMAPACFAQLVSGDPQPGMAQMADSASNSTAKQQVSPASQGRIVPSLNSSAHGPTLVEEAAGIRAPRKEIAFTMALVHPFDSGKPDPPRAISGATPVSTAPASKTPDTVPLTGPALAANDGGDTGRQDANHGRKACASRTGADHCIDRIHAAGEQHGSIGVHRRHIGRPEVLECPTLITSRAPNIQPRSSRPPPSRVLTCRLALNQRQPLRSANSS